MNPTLTATLAVWGAVVATISLLWQVFLWRRSRPLLAVEAQMNDGHLGDDGDWIGFEIRNRGGRATTVEEIMLVGYGNWALRTLKLPQRCEYLSAYHRDTIKLPVVLQPGEVWKGYCPLGPTAEIPRVDDTRRKQFAAGRLFYRVKCAHSNRLISGTVKPEPQITRM